MPVTTRREWQDVLNARAAELFANIRRRLSKGRRRYLSRQCRNLRTPSMTTRCMTAAATTLITWKAIAGSVSASSRAKHRRENAHEAAVSGWTKRGALYAQTDVS